MMHSLLTGTGCGDTVQSPSSSRPKPNLKLVCLRSWVEPQMNQEEESGERARLGNPAMSVHGANEKLTEGHRKELLPRKSLRSAEGLGIGLLASE